MFKKKLSLFLAFVLLFSIFTFTADAETVGHRYVNTSNKKSLNLREETNTNSKVLTTIPNGTKIVVVDYHAHDTWANVVYNDFFGFVQTRYLSLHKPIEQQPTEQEGENLFSNFVQAYYVASVTPSSPTGFVHMRWAPSKKMPIFKDYYAGARLHVLYENETWCQVYDPVSNLSGFMMKAFLNPLYAMSEQDKSI